MICRGKAQEIYSDGESGLDAQVPPNRLKWGTVYWQPFSLGSLGALRGPMEAEGPAHPESVGSFGSKAELFLACDMLTIGPHLRFLLMKQVITVLGEKKL